jgi:hypothetical protein
MSGGGMAQNDELLLGLVSIPIIILSFFLISLVTGSRDGSFIFPNEVVKAKLDFKD